MDTLTLSSRTSPLWPVSCVPFTAKIMTVQSSNTDTNPGMSSDVESSPNIGADSIVTPEPGSGQSDLGAPNPRVSGSPVSGSPVSSLASPRVESPSPEVPHPEAPSPAWSTFELPHGDSDVGTSVKTLRLPKPDRDNITVLLHNLPKDPVLPWNHYDSPWEGQGSQEDEAVQSEEKGRSDGTDLELDVDLAEDAGGGTAEVSDKDLPEASVEASAEDVVGTMAKNGSDTGADRAMPGDAPASALINRADPIVSPAEPNWVPASPAVSILPKPGIVPPVPETADALDPTHYTDQTAALGLEETADSMGPDKGRLDEGRPDSRKPDIPAPPTPEPDDPLLPESPNPSPDLARLLATIAPEALAAPVPDSPTAPAPIASSPPPLDAPDPAPAPLPSDAPDAATSDLDEDDLRAQLG